MKEFDYREFYNNIKKDFSEAYKHINFIEQHEYMSGMYGYNDRVVNYKNDIDYIQELDYNESALVSKFQQIKFKFDFAYEYLELPKMSNSLEAQLKEYDGKFATLNMCKYIDDFYSPVLGIFYNQLHVLTSHVKIEDKTQFADINQISLLERILSETPKILTDRGIQPCNEAEVRKEIYNTLTHIFSDTTKEVPIPKVAKTYKPDIGIRSLGVAIEYKFIDSLEEAKTAIGGIFEDVQGYGGSLDWTTFYAVFYMTNHFLTVGQVEAEFKHSKVPSNWNPIVVYGKGGRREIAKPVNTTRKATKHKK